MKKKKKTRERKEEKKSLKENVNIQHIYTIRRKSSPKSFGVFICIQEALITGLLYPDFTVCNEPKK
jgi:hypothetical protein